MFSSSKAILSFQAQRRTAHKKMSYHICIGKKRGKKKKIVLDALFLIVSISQQGSVLLRSCEKSWCSVRCGRWRSVGCWGGGRFWRLGVCTRQLTRRVAQDQDGGWRVASP